ncbi:MAG TPA: 2-isopropylmalate synthase [Thermomicrobiaceae bacterium]|nr:2-isopropylmalate synthase [Thermomicrobiaceae bacterium]
MGDRVTVFDTTLRDGEQSPGATMTTPEKLEVARALSRLGVDVIEAGFAAASPGDLEAVRTIARDLRGVTVCSLARTNAADIDAAWEAIRPAEQARIHTFIATSPVHMEYKLRRTPDQVVEAARAAVARARQYVSDIEFSAEDATRSDWDFLCRIFAAAIEEGATTINIPDTVGYTTPEEYARLIQYVQERTYGIEKAVLSVHCHDDLGMATANTLSAIEAGARQIEVTINGIGERAGNTSLEEVVMALHTRRDVYPGLQPRIVTDQLVPTSRLVSRITGIVVQPNKAIVGANAFAHEAGIHQDGMLKHRDTYEIMTPQSVGWEATRLVLGKHSGRAGFSARLKDLGYGDLAGDRINELYHRFIDLTDRKKVVTDADIMAIVEEDLQQPPEHYVLTGWRANSGSDGRAEAWVKIAVAGTEREATATGNGQIDALFSAIDRLIGNGFTLESFHIDAVTPGEDAQGEVSVHIRRGDHVYNGRGVATDIVEASVRAYLMGLNRAAVSAEVVA